ncbi:uncharacterized protein [Miscanthus floridulus]|uniref:uncharacterized protein n=1 Tax=Miscanthus floridulus TaxID=154761 RepID=UPI00345AB609
MASQLISLEELEIPTMEGAQASTKSKDVKEVALVPGDQSKTAQIREEDQIKTSFIMPFDTYCYTTMSYGLKNMGNIVNRCDIKANPEKITVVINMKPPTYIKDVQKLMGCMAALSHFISCLGKKGIPFFKLLKAQEKFVWSKDADKAFAELKQFPTTPTIITTPKKDETLLIYIIVTNWGYGRRSRDADADTPAVVFPGAPHRGGSPVGLGLRCNDRLLRPHATGGRRVRTQEQRHSTFSRVLLNALLPRHGKVGYLDTDVGQPEFGPPGCLSFHVVDEAIADLLNPTLREAERCYFFGDISSKRDPETYLNCLFHLYDYFVGKYRCDENEMLPLIVNTPGWVKGAGFDMLVEMLRLLIQKDSGGMRERRLVEYLKQCFPSNISLSTNKELAHALASLPPYQVLFSDVKLCIFIARYLLVRYGVV